ncbi:MAG: thiosulfate oxidation carrier complex protein SoxZ [Betaproteobacteria bacterium]|nr:thiosulfate oxidation carrier complex protein SoxZ [Pseudomonadota bacterium]NBP36138.1 thiosulfate oxidation carrier complex protein SoxZ [Betaproteobacteria bacterium]HAB46997.1 thiosulfate oxidation carrier complex protein SoxZ [Lautropia sp.]NBP39333.1 thiosulfate oxidation carrier complex protein SoxZ [Betaproteobacteria bacterium]NBQ10238.1 thiosulfate oxidation carrier complex protein SoxZ [Betaproteobacteria bacterium]
MSVIADALVTVPTTVIKGQIFEIRTLVRHDMESGFRHTEQGVRVPRRIIREFSCMYNDLEVFRATLYPGTSANPMFVFYCRAEKSGDLVFRWVGDNDYQTIYRKPILVT